MNSSSISSNVTTNANNGTIKMTIPNLGWDAAGHLTSAKLSTQTLYVDNEIILVDDLKHI
jgi:hypothetical protein